MYNAVSIPKPVMAIPHGKPFHLDFSHGYPVTSAAPNPSPYNMSLGHVSSRPPVTARQSHVTPHTTQQHHFQMPVQRNLQRSESFDAASILVKMNTEKVKVTKKHQYDEEVDEEEEEVDVDQHQSKKPKW